MVHAMVTHWMQSFIVEFLYGWKRQE